MIRQFKDIDATSVYIAIGGGLYWGLSAVTFIKLMPRYGISADIPALEGVSFICLLIFTFLATALSSKFASRKWCLGLIIAGLLSAAICATIGLTPIASSYLAQLISAMLLGLYHASFVLFWGLNFASLNKDNAELSVALALLVGAIAYLSLIGLPLNPFALVVVTAIKGFGTIPYLMGRYDIKIVKRTPQPNITHKLAPLALSRLFFGVAIGILFCLPNFTDNTLPAISPLLSLIAIIAVGAYLLVSFKRRYITLSWLRIAPLLALGFLLIPFLLPSHTAASFTFPAFAKIAVAFVWLSWIILSSVQLSEAKETIGWSESRISFLEKAVVITGWFVGFGAAHTLCSNLDEQSVTLFANSISPLLLYLSLALSSYLLSGLIASKQGRSIAERTLELSNNKTTLAVEAIANTYGLTERERAVLVLLARGCSRTAISKELFVSDSTVKSHIAHIYEKIGIHSRDEIMTMVAKEEKNIVCSPEL